MIKGRSNSKPTSDDYIEEWKHFLSADPVENYEHWLKELNNENAQPLPKYDENGQRYTYTLNETAITLENVPNSKLVYLDPVINTYLVENGYRSIQRARLLADPLLGAINPRDDHTVHPVGYFGG